MEVLSVEGLSQKDAESLIPQAQAAVDAANELLVMLEQAKAGHPIEPFKVLIAVSNSAQKALAAALAISFDSNVKPRAE